MNAIIINQHELPIKEYLGQRVVTFKEIDTLHERPEGTARRNFRVNRKHFHSGEDFFHVSMDEIRPLNWDDAYNYPKGLTLVTESGYLMLVKSFTDDLAWHVQRELVNLYFRVKEAQNGTYPPKSSSLGEVTRWAKLQDSILRAQHSSPQKRAAAFLHTAKQFGISVISQFTEPVDKESQQITWETSAPILQIGVTVAPNP